MLLAVTVQLGFAGRGWPWLQLLRPWRGELFAAGTLPPGTEQCHMAGRGDEQASPSLPVPFAGFRSTELPKFLK